ncbi:rhodanese-like domain-containing protein [Sporichthya polymorpha]|uniref:rhodanese-like domain-containing protein n=1 Tax=Sporichthya polymorpha TaxID=35751 RepID=UPI00036B2E3A|nr:rhodanese-like domain-containing protein [Sporichthya polymorpha]
MTVTAVSPCLGFDLDAPVLSLSRSALLEAQARGAVVLDTRDAERFAAGHWPGSVNIALDGPFALQATLAFCGNAEIALICDPGTEVEARNQLGGLGLHRVCGVLAGGLGPLDAHRLVTGLANESARTA